MLCISVVKQLDSVLYPASLLWDNDDKRRSLYGKIGSFRPKSYGVEWRPLSNAFLSSKETQRYVFRTTKKLVDLLLNHDVKVFEDERSMSHAIHDGYKPTESEVRDYLSYIEEKYGVQQP